MAPEYISGSVDEITSASDIWSLGATVVELITGQPPLRDLAPMVAAYHIIEGGVSPIPENISDKLKSFLSYCFDLDPKKRYTAKQLLQHPWIQKEVPLKLSRVRKIQVISFYNINILCIRKLKILVY